jgi:hypothetical protein
VWLARYTGRDGKRRIAKPTWNRSKGTFVRKADAQRAIDEAYGLSDRPDTLGAYFATWADRHLRRATTGAIGIIRSLSAMAEDAITDEVCDLNPFKGIRIRASDPRAQKRRRPIRVFSFDECTASPRAPVPTRRWSGPLPTPG